MYGTCTTLYCYMLVPKRERHPFVNRDQPCANGCYSYPFANGCLAPSVREPLSDPCAHRYIICLCAHGYFHRLFATSTSVREPLHSSITHYRKQSSPIMSINTQS